MPNQQLIDYITQSIAQGASIEKIKSALLGAGWKEADVNEGLLAVFPVSAQRSAVGGKSKALIMIVSVFAALLLAGGFAYWKFVYQTTVRFKIAVDQSITQEGWKTYNSKDGFFISYPPEWSLGENKNGGVCLGSDKEYVDFYCYGKTSIRLPDIGFKTRLMVNRNIVPLGMPQKEALQQENGRGVLPLLDEKYLIINRTPAYRALRQMKKGELSLWGGEGGDSIFEITRTDVEYTFLKDADLYRIWFELDSNEPEIYIPLFDKVAQTFRFTVK